MTAALLSTTILVTGSNVPPMTGWRLVQTYAETKHYTVSQKTSQV